jgi:hypothetical protein
MGRKIDYGTARQLLAGAFQSAEEGIRAGVALDVPQEVEAATDQLFASSTQAFREALVGCALARIIDPEIDVRLPYMKQGANAFNGRTLDEKVVNPFLRDRSIPCSTGPYLSALRRNIRFEPETARGIRDRRAYAAFLTFVSALGQADAVKARLYLQYLLRGFIQLRNAAKITLSRIHRLSVEQYETLTGRLLAVPSGGLMPVLLAAAMFYTIRECFGLDWEIEWQGINVSDRAVGAGGDITIRRKGVVVLAVEVTEREIDRSRVVSTFNTKISPHGIDDYLFFFSASLPSEEARVAARQYFAQGHEINFVPVKDWIITTLTTIGPRCRAMFTVEFLKLLENRDVPAALKVAWNDQVKNVIP